MFISIFFAENWWKCGIVVWVYKQFSKQERIPFNCVGQEIIPFFQGLVEIVCHGMLDGCCASFVGANVEENLWLLDCVRGDEGEEKEEGEKERRGWHGCVLGGSFFGGGKLGKKIGSLLSFFSLSRNLFRVWFPSTQPPGE